MLFAELSDAAVTALIVAFGTACGSAITIGLPLLAGIVTVWLQVSRIEKNTDGIKDALVKSTGDTKFLEGGADERAKVAAKAGTDALAVADAAKLLAAPSKPPPVEVKPDVNDPTKLKPVPVEVITPPGKPLPVTETKKSPQKP